MGNERVSITAPGDGSAVWLLGQELIQFKARGEETAGLFCLFEDTSPPGYGPPPHVHHGEDESFYVLEGEFLFVGESGDIPAGPGSFVHVPKGALHTYRNAGTTRGRLLVLVTPAGFERFFDEAGEVATNHSVPPSSPTDPQRLLEIAPKYGLEIRASEP